MNSEFHTGQLVEVSDDEFITKATGRYVSYFPNDRQPHTVRVNGTPYAFEFCRPAKKTTDSNGFTRSDILGGLRLLLDDMVETLEDGELDTTELKQLYAKAYVCQTYVEDLKKMEDNQ